MPASYGYQMAMHAWPLIKYIHGYIKMYPLPRPLSNSAMLCSLLNILWPSPPSYVATLRSILFNRTYSKILLYHNVQVYGIEDFTKIKHYETNASLSSFIRLNQIVKAIA